jgi:hypothetical protein
MPTFLLWYLLGKEITYCIVGIGRNETIMKTMIANPIFFSGNHDRPERFIKAQMSNKRTKIDR